MKLAFTNKRSKHEEDTGDKRTIHPRGLASQKGSQKRLLHELKPHGFFKLLSGQLSPHMPKAHTVGSRPAARFRLYSEDLASATILLPSGGTVLP